MSEYFTDENFSEVITRILNIYDSKNTITWLPEYLGGRGILDTEWIPRIASEKPDAIIIGGDNAILKKPHERLLLKESNLMYVIMGSNYNNLPMRDQLIRTIQIWDDLVKKTSKTKTKKIFEVIIKKKGLPVIEEISVTSELHIDERRIK